MKRAAKIVKTIGLLILSFLLIYFGLGLLFSIIPVNRQDLKCVSDQTLYASTNGVHVDLIIPVEQIDSSLAKMIHLDEDVQYVGFGWGDRKFYLETPEWSDLRISTVSRAFFVKSSSLVHVSYHAGRYKHWESMSVCEAQLKGLNEALKEAFYKNESGQAVELVGQGYSNQDTFFEGKGKYSLFKTCNVWTNQKMKRAEIPAVYWTPFPFPIMKRFEGN